MEYLELEDLLRLTDLLGAGPVRDVGLLEAAAARPRSGGFGAELFPTVHLKAASLLHSLCRNHPLVDGNKRLSLLACVTFLRLNGESFSMSQDDAFHLVMAVAEGDLDVEAIAQRLN